MTHNSPLLREHEIRQQFVSLPIDSTEAMNGDGDFSAKATVLHQALKQMYAVINDTEDKAFGRTPELKVNRLAVLGASTAPDVIEQSYWLYDLIDRLPETAAEPRRKILDLLGFLNNYDPYINVRGVLERKQEMLEKFPGAAFMTNDRFAVTAAQSMDILRYQKDSEYEGYEERDRKLSDDGYAVAHETIRDFLLQSGALKAFGSMGFAMGNDFDSYTCPADNPQMMRITGLSNTHSETAFIAVHQVFETFFDELLSLLRGMSTARVADMRVDDVRNASLILDTVNKFYDVIKHLVPRNSFNEMRSSFGIASGAQSQQYHLIESHIGFPGDAAKRQKSVRFLIGDRFMNEITAEAPVERSLKERSKNCRDPEMLAALRGLNLSVLDFKSIHGLTMLKYLKPEVVGSGGTAITHYFADGMGAIFENLFEPKELQELSEAIHKARHIPGVQVTDGFSAVRKFASEARKKTLTAH